MRPIGSRSVRSLATLVALAPFASAQVWEESTAVPTGGAPRLDPIGLVEGGEILAISGSPYIGGPTGDSRVDAFTTGGGWVQHERLEGPIIGQGVGIDELGRIVIFGGWDGPDPEGDLGSVYVYDRTEGLLLDLADRNSSVEVHGVTSATDDAHRIYSIGGDSYSNHVERYDGIADAWTTVAPMPTGRFDATAVNDGRGHILVIGGLESYSTPTASIDSFDVATGTWSSTQVADLPVALYECRAAMGADGRLYVAGGRGAQGSVESRTWVLDLDTNVWIEGPSMVVPRRRFAFVLGPDDHLYAIGGDDGAGGTNRMERLFTSTCPIAGTAPTSVEAWDGLSVTLHVFFAGATPIDFQWTKDGIDLVDGPTTSGSVVSGATTDTLHVSGLSAADVGSYRLEGTNSCGTDTSDAANVTVRTVSPLGPWISVRRMDPFGSSSTSAGAIDGTRVFGNGTAPNPNFADQSQGVAWNAAGEVAQTYTPGNSVGSSIADSLNGRTVGWWWWPYTVLAGTGYYQHAATWDPVTGTLIDIQPSGWEIGSVSATNGTQHVGTLRRSDESTTVDGAYWTQNIKSATILTPAIAWGSSTVALDGNHQYGSSNMGYGIVYASRWSGSASSWEDWHPAGAGRSYLTGADDGLVIGSGFWGNTHKALVWGDGPDDWVEFLPAGATDVTLYDTERGRLLGSVTDANGTRAALWAGLGGSELDLTAAAAHLGFDSVSVRRLRVGENGHALVVGSGNSATAGQGGVVVWSIQPEPLVAAPAALSLAEGGRHELYLAAGQERAGHVYFVLGSASGSTPGVPVAGGFTVPLVPDAYTNLTLAGANGVMLRSTLGVLDGAGGGHAALALPAGTMPGLAGTTLHHAFLAWDGFGVLSFVSNATAVDLVP
jgi:hypothetical protein